jgi:hypothetical protein
MATALTLAQVHAYFSNVPFVPEITAIGPLSVSTSALIAAAYPVVVHGQPEWHTESIKKRNPDLFARGYNNELLVGDDVMCLRYSS